MSDVKRAVVSWGRIALGSADLVLQPGGNLRTGIEDFETFFPNPTSLEKDVLVVASAIYACDLAFKRGERENITRSIEVTIPVTNIQAFERLNSQLQLLLWILSHDVWSFNFKRQKGLPEPAEDWPKSDGKTLLFSGGLDSFAGAVDLLDDIGASRVQLSSHVTANPVTRKSQNDLANYLTGKYTGALNRVVVRTGGHSITDLPFPDYNDREETQRTRSFMFLSIAALAARRSGQSEIVMIAENGQMAIHLPLSAARMGAFSTHTAHPEFVHGIGEYFTELLGFPVHVTNPYLYRTKGEVVKKLVSKYPDSIHLSVSCWKGSRVSTDTHHCGACIPCLTRRVSLEFNGLCLKEYERDLLSEDVLALPPDDTGKRNLVELVEFAYLFKTLSDTELEFIYPELINKQIDKANAISMYRRVANEVETVLRNYPNAAKLMSPASADSTPPAPAKKTASRKKR
jgi:7-cyano-7-deazaguanine synthase in queuosine biosynthesis